MTVPTGPTGAARATPAPEGRLGPTGNIALSQEPDQGQLTPIIQDRAPQHYFISEMELAMLETGSGATDRTIAGLAVGAAIAFAVVDRTVKGLSPYNHALFVIGFWGFLILAGYSTIRAIKARTVNRKIAADVRRRKADDSSDGGSGSTSPLSLREKVGQWIAGRRG